MGSLNNIVTVSVSTLTTAVKQPGFGVPLIADYHTRWSERVRFYSDLAGMLTDGFTVNDGAYKAAAAVFAQSPQVTQLAIGRRANPPDLTVEFTPSAVNTKAYKIDVIGPAGVTGTASYTSDGTATVAEITAGLTSAINGLAAGVTATDLTTAVRVKAGAAGQWFSASAQDTSLLASQQTHADPGIAADLAAIALENGTWYGLTLTTQGKSETTAAAAWAESALKLAFFTTQDMDTTTVVGTDIASVLKNATEYRSAPFYSHRGDSFVGAAALGAGFPYDPGSLTFKFLRLAGVPSTPLTDTQIANLQSKNCNFYTDFGGVSITAEGKVAAGEFIDVIRDRDWFQSRLQTRVYSALINARKVPFTDAGIAAVEAEVRAQLAEAISAGFLTASPAPVVTVPLASQVASIDKAARRLKTIQFNATLAGAIHLATISGTITV
jgi:hypothetical protein